MSFQFLGSPFQCDIQPGGGGEGAARMATRSLTVRGEGLHQAVVGAPAFFDVDPGGTRMDEQVEVEIMGMQQRYYLSLQAITFFVNMIRNQLYNMIFLSLHFL